ncbi:MAG: recombinase family protein [Negativicutes bacterium]|nr:recombinase family protein [Negativicutes bacterium]
MRKNIEIIPAKQINELKGLEATAKTRVCAYCRVSTDNEDQLSSLEAQISYYSNLISNNTKWNFVGIYTDEGISGTNTKNRLEFNRMIDDCMAGKIDIVMTKSISRFARNTVDCLKYVRQLKEKNIAIIFEKENINTLDGRGDFLITLLSSLAQEESSGLSRSTRIGIVYRFQEGKIRVNHTWFLGYTKDANGDLVIVPEQAEIVKRIFREFLLGKSAYSIIKGLQRDGIKNGAGNIKWWDSNIYQILKNEKHMGDALLQKSYTIDFLTKKRVRNDGYVPKYYVENSHEGIVSKEEFAAVQVELARRTSLRGYSKTGKSEYSSKLPFSGKLYCSNCGAKFNRNMWGTGKYKKPVWICVNHKMNGEKACPQKAVMEWDLERAFVKAINQVIGGKETFMERLFENIYKGLAMVEHEFTQEQIGEHLAKLQQELMSLVRLNAKTGLDTREYDNEYGQLAAEIERFRALRQTLLDDEAQKVIRIQRIDDLRDFLQSQTSPLEYFNEDLFRRLIEKVSVKSLVEATFVFKTGVEVREVLGG